MPQMLRLSLGHWLNLDQIVEVCEQKGTLVVVCAPLLTDEKGEMNPTMLWLKGEERERLLAWLAYHSTYVAMSRPDNDNPFEENTDEPTD